MLSAVKEKAAETAVAEAEPPAAEAPVAFADEATETVPIYEPPQSFGDDPGLSFANENVASAMVRPSVAS